MNRFGKLLSVFAFSLLILGLPVLASAQWNGGGGYGRNNGGGYLNAAIKDLKSRSKSFSHELDRDLDRSRIDGTRREDRINEVAKEFRDAASRLDSRSNGGRDIGRSYNEADNTLRLGRELQNMVGRARISNNLQGDWNLISQDLRTIADAYGTNGRGNGGYGNGRRNFSWPF
jgi:hypothetical protein